MALLSDVEQSIGASRTNDLDAERQLKAVKDILGHLFPVFGNYLSNPQNPSLLHAKSFGPSFERDLRISSSAHFDTYFRLIVPSGEIPTSLVKEFTNLVSAPGNVEVSQVADTLLHYHQQRHLVRFLQKLTLYSDDLTALGRRRVLQAILSLTPELDWTDRFEFLTEARAALLVVMDTLINRDVLSEAQGQLEDAVDYDVELDFAAAIIQVSDPSGDSRKAPEGLDFDALVEKLRLRIETEQVQPEANVFLEFPHSYGVILAAWRSPTAVNDRPGYDRYIARVLAMKPRSALTIVSGFVSVALQSGDPAMFDYQLLKSEYNVNIIREALSKVDQSQIDDPVGQYAIDRFNFHFQQDTSSK